MPIGLNNNLVSNMVNNVFRLNGKNPEGADRNDSIKATGKAAQDFGGDAFISSRQLKDALENPDRHVALSFKDSNHPERSEALADMVVGGLDRADGSPNGMVSLAERGGWADFLHDMGFSVGAGMISTGELRRALSSGLFVIGEGGQLMTKREAQERGDSVLAIHENQSGPKLAYER